MLLEDRYVKYETISTSSDKLVKRFVSNLFLYIEVSEGNYQLVEQNAIFDSSKTYFTYDSLYGYIEYDVTASDWEYKFKDELYNDLYIFMNGGYVKVEHRATYQPMYNDKYYKLINIHYDQYDTANYSDILVERFISGLQLFIEISDGVYQPVEPNSIFDENANYFTYDGENYHAYIVQASDHETKFKEDIYGTLYVYIGGKYVKVANNETYNPAYSGLYYYQSSENYVEYTVKTTDYQYILKDIQANVLNLYEKVNSYDLVNPGSLYVEGLSYLTFTEAVYEKINNFESMLTKYYKDGLNLYYYDEENSTYVHLNSETAYDPTITEYFLHDSGLYIPYTLVENVDIVKKFNDYSKLYYKHPSTGRYIKVENGALYDQTLDYHLLKEDAFYTEITNIDAYIVGDEGMKIFMKELKLFFAYFDKHMVIQGNSAEGRRDGTDIAVVPMFLT